MRGWRVPAPPRPACVDEHVCSVEPRRGGGHSPIRNAPPTSSKMRYGHGSRSILPVPTLCRYHFTLTRAVGARRLHTGCRAGNASRVVRLWPRRRHGAVTLVTSVALAGCRRRRRRAHDTTTSRTRGTRLRSVVRAEEPSLCRTTHRHRGAHPAPAPPSSSAIDRWWTRRTVSVKKRTVEFKEKKSLLQSSSKDLEPHFERRATSQTCHPQHSIVARVAQCQLRAVAEALGRTAALYMATWSWLRIV